MARSQQTSHSKYQAVLTRYGLDNCSFVVVGADRRPENATWCVMVTGDTQPEYVDIATAESLAIDLERIGEVHLAERLAWAVQTAKRQSRKDSL